jgi:predicted nucleotide-binding protein (sugar kinase/HSP70/actin superfamily)
MFWRGGQAILAAATLVKEDPRLQAIYVTNFNCGPDSFILSFFRRIMGDKPYLELEFDDHTADAGVVTRCEAFFESLKMDSGALLV